MFVGMTRPAPTLSAAGVGEGGVYVECIFDGEPEDLGWSVNLVVGNSVVSNMFLTPVGEGGSVQLVIEPEMYLYQGVSNS